MLLNFQPHMHVRGKAMSMEAIYPDGRVEMLNRVDRFDFNWHVNYVYADEAAPVLPKGTIVKITAWHDNTASYHAHVNVTYLTDADYEAIVTARKKTRLE